MILIVSGCSQKKPQGLQTLHLPYHRSVANGRKTNLATGKLTSPKPEKQQAAKPIANQASQGFWECENFQNLHG